MKTSNLLALLGGIAVGVILGMLFSPDSGKNNRAKINDYLRSKGINLSSEELDQFIEKMKAHFGSSHSSSEACENVDNQ